MQLVRVPKLDRGYDQAFSCSGQAARRYSLISPPRTLWRRDRDVNGDLRGEVVAWWVLIEALMRAVVIEVAHVPVKNNSGVSLVVDQQSVGAFGADAANEPFRIAVRLRRPRRDLDHGDAEAKTASKAPVNFESRSRIRKRKVLI